MDARRIRALAIAKLAKREGLETSQIVARLASEGCSAIYATIAIREVEAIELGDAKKAILDHDSYALARVDWDAVANEVNEHNAESGSKPGADSKGEGT